MNQGKIKILIPVGTGRLLQATEDADKNWTKFKYKFKTNHWLATASKQKALIYAQKWH